MIVAGGGVIYSEATETLARFVDATGIPVGETMAGKGSLRWDHPLNLGAIGVTGTLAANRIARDADLVIGIGTRYSDFTTASKTAWQNPDVRFININVTEFDAGKHHGLPVVGDAQVTLEELGELLARGDRGRPVPGDRVPRPGQRLHDEWDAEVQRIYDIRLSPLPSQGELIGAINEVSGPDAIMLNAAGSHARRPAQALADDAPQELPPGVRQQLHGLRDRGRDGRQDGRAGARRVRHRRRRHLPDALVRAGHVGAGRTSS